MASFFTVMLAPGMTPPDVSTTVPDSDEVFAPCPWARVLMEPISTVKANVQIDLLSLFIIHDSLRKGLAKVPNA